MIFLYAFFCCWALLVGYMYVSSLVALGIFAATVRQGRKWVGREEHIGYPVWLLAAAFVVIMQ